MTEVTKQKQTKEQLFTRAKVVQNEILVLKEDLEALAQEFTYCKDENVFGLDKKVVGKTIKAAGIDAANSFEKLVDKRLEQEEFEEFFKELTDY